MSHLEVGWENLRARISWILRKESNTKTNLCEKSIGIGHHRGQKWGPSKRQRGEGAALVFQWLRFCASKSKARVGSLIREPVSQSVQSLSCVRLFVTPWTAACQASLSFTNSWSLLKLMPIESVMPSNHLILCHPLLLLPSIFPTIRVFSNESTLCIRWPKYWSFSFSISPSNEYSGLISLRMDWLDLLAVRGTFKSLLQHHNSKATILRCSVLLYSPTLTSIYDCWKNHCFD